MARPRKRCENHPGRQAAYRHSETLGRTYYCAECRRKAECFTCVKIVYRKPA